MKETRLGGQHNCITHKLNLYYNRLRQYKQQNTEDT